MIPIFIRSQQDQSTIDKITKGHWELRAGRILAVKGTNIVLIYGTLNEGPYHQSLADQHNINIMMGMTDEEYNQIMRAKNV